MNALIRTKAPHSATAPRQPNETASKQAVEIEHLRKTYGTLVAVDDVSFSVAEGEIFGDGERTERARPPRSSARSASARRTREQSG